MINSTTLNTIQSIAVSAGKKIMEIYQRDFKTYLKDDKSPLTEADLTAHSLICGALRECFPELPVLSEESSDIQYQDRKNWEAFWLVDPLDGTKEFVKKNDEFTVNIALIVQGQPVLGVVYAPALDIIYAGAEGVGAYKEINGQQSVISVINETPENWILVGSRSHRGEAMDDYLKRFASYKFIAIGSSLKLCMVAEGSAHLYPRLGPTSEWDTGAADAVVRAAGGVVTDIKGNALQYNKEIILNPWFVVHGKDLKVPSL
ncbi:3'(2'),5'-bisphosphate nucleotidase CysQ [Litoribrevibacter albus]|uniref:3'(2'),5'-bisphosphate nucleotidase CysQ n=1 Tax=Litoribrevibacter albus TaxID=1473156 RepID=A0AA37SEU6_9GAMM|nr:3'(2'),5'-bisphosphate nucleotidase CysQ [Litoribrevibacter albus]GLQ33201.1 3'(2'),5'-bisphosphate nucleotidase CysQ [Litoribrevibacter albus]